MSAVADDRALGVGLLAEPHHDGSDAYVLERPDAPDGTAVVRLRVPRALAVGDVALRYLHDGEARHVPATLDEETEAETWWRASFPTVGAATRYRWLVAGGGVGYAWVTGAGLVDHDVPDADDFVLLAGPHGPDWHLGSVVYEIFPDRFARGGVDAEPPDWAIRREWDDLPGPRGRTSAELFGGDLRGVEAHLDHVERLGANVLYLTPVFPAGSTHRYDARTFDRVDPLLGGDEAFASLVAAAHGRGMRVLGDLTPNHTGVGHDWFAAGEEDLYYVDDAFPHGYASWLGVRVLPKLNWGSEETRRRMLDVARRWVERGLDGWRVDVANMVGRLGEEDLNADVARALRAAVEGARPDGLVIAEHFHDHRPDLRPGGWHGIMNYSGFLKPLFQWLRDAEIHFDLPVPLPRLTGRQAVATMRAFRAGVPWQAVLHSWTLLDSHDTPRFRTVAGSRARHGVGLGLQMTTPGVPMVYAGDELGLEGGWGEDGRRTMPWHRRDAWDEGLVEAYRRLIALRRSSDALTRGGIRYAHVGADAIAYLREARAERLLCLAARADHDPVRLPLHALGCSTLEPVIGAEATCEHGWAALPGDGPAFHVWRID